MEDSRLSNLPVDVRKQLVRVAVSLFVLKGFDRTTTRELSKALGWSIGRLYQYVKTKDDLISLLVDFVNERDYEIGDYADRIINGLDPIEAVRVVLRLHIINTDQYQDLYKFMAHITLNLDKDARRKLFTSSRAMKDHYVKLIERGIKLGEFTTDNAELVAYNMFNVTSWATCRWLFNRHYRLEEYIEGQTDNILKQLGVEYSKRKTKICCADEHTEEGAK